MTQNEYLVQAFEALSKAQGASMAVPIRWVRGGGHILITKTEWAAQPTLEAKQALVLSRTNSLWQRINEEARQCK